MQALNASNKSPNKVINNGAVRNDGSFFTELFFSLLLANKEIIMEALIFFGGIVLVVTAFIVVYKIYENETWDRQNYMSKINRLFE